MEGIQISEHKIFAPEIAAMIKKDLLLFEYLSDSTNDALLAAFVLDPIKNLNTIQKIIDLLSMHEDKKHLFSLPTIYWKSFSLSTLEDMKKYMEENPSDTLYPDATETILNLSLKSVNQRELTRSIQESKWNNN